MRVCLVLGAGHKNLEIPLLVERLFFDWSQPSTASLTPYPYFLMACPEYSIIYDYNFSISRGEKLWPEQNINIYSTTEKHTDLHSFCFSSERVIMSIRGPGKFAVPG